MLIKKIQAFFNSIDEIQRSKAAEAYEIELKELNNIFALLVFGSFVGIPSTPVHISTELFDVMPEELDFMLKRVSTANDPLSELFSTLDVA